MAGHPGGAAAGLQGGRGERRGDGNRRYPGEGQQPSDHGQHEPFDSALELRALPCLSDLICERWHPDLLEFLRETPFVDEVTLLNHGQRTLDLRGTSIRKLMLDMTGLEELWLCEGTELLLFQNKGPDACAIHAPEDGSGLTLQFIGEYRPHTELPNLRGLHGIELKDFDLTGLAAVHPHPGADAGASLVLDDQPAGDGGKSGKAALEKQAGNGSADHQTPETGVAGAKSGQSLPGLGRAEHIPAAAAKKAANQYRKTRSLLMKLAAEPGEDAQAQALDAVAAYTQTFNKMGFIETEKRDEIYMALRGILDALPDGTLQKDA